MVAEVGGYRFSGEVGSGQDGSSVPWATFEGAKMACLGCEKVMGGPTSLTAYIQRNQGAKMAFSAVKRW